MRSVFFGKLGALAAVIATLVFALGAVGGIAEERQLRQQGAAQALLRSLAGEQTLVGPMLRLQCEETWTRTEGTGPGSKKVGERKAFVHVLWPQTLSVSTHVGVEPRYRGLFKVNGYLSDSTLTADWGALDLPSASGANRDAQVSCQPPTLTMVLTDVRGVRSASVSVNEIDRHVEAGSAPGEAGGLHADLPGLSKASGPIHAVIKLALVGTGSIAWSPVGDQSTVELMADWPHPSFAGQFLPVTREMTPQGFQARWHVSSLASSAQQQYRAGGKVCDLQDARDEDAGSAHTPTCADSFGVRFIDPVSPYVLSERAVKYGILFIVLTFVGVGLVELTKQLRVHPMQYLLVGCALTVFFLLLIGLSEHIGFGRAYACAAVACSGLLAFYGAHLLKGLRAGMLFGVSIGLLYGALFLLLQQEQTALMLGSLLLFLVIAVIMVVTRRTDWYAIFHPVPPPSCAVTQNDD